MASSSGAGGGVGVGLGAETHQFLKASIQFGNSKGPIQFGSKVSVFHHDDIPEKARKRHNDILNWKKSTTLSTEKPGWTSQGIHAVACERRTMENYKHDRSGAYQFNYRAETLDTLRMAEPFDRPTKFHVSAQMEQTAESLVRLRSVNKIQAGQFKRTQIMPVNPALDSATPWETTMILTKKQQDASLDAMTARSLEWTKKVTDTVPARTAYVSPIQSSINLQEEVRRQKALGIFETTKGIFAPPIPPVNRAELRNRYAIEKPAVRVSHKHSGVWERSRVDGRSMWSDTGSNEFATNGDVQIKINQDAYNFAAPNSFNDVSRAPPKQVSTHPYKP